MINIVFNKSIHVIYIYENYWKMKEILFLLPIFIFFFFNLTPRNTILKDIFQFTHKFLFAYINIFINLKISPNQSRVRINWIKILRVNDFSLPPL